MEDLFFPSSLCLSNTSMSRITDITRSAHTAVQGTRSVATLSINRGCLDTELTSLRHPVQFSLF